MTSIIDQVKAFGQLYNTTGVDVAGTNIHKGSWLGLPDLGVTEVMASSGSGGTTQDLSNALAGYPVTSGGQIYGENLISNNPTPVTTQTSTTGGTPTPVTNPTNPTPSDQNKVIEDAYNKIRSQITGGYDAYLSSLTNILENGLPTQLSIQNKIVDNQLQSGLGDLSTQNELGLNALNNESAKINQNQVKNLYDISSNIANLMQAGNNYMGSIGASGSAPKQYAYALSRLASEQRGNIVSQTRDLQSQIDQRKWQMSTMYHNEVNKLNSEAQTKALQISQWFFDAQNQLVSQKGKLEFNKSQDLANLSTSLLDQAIAKIDQIQYETSQKRSLLEQWVLNNSKTLAEAMAGFNQVAQYNPAMPTYNPMASALGGGQTDTKYLYGGYNSDEDEDLFS